MASDLEPQGSVTVDRAPPQRRSRGDRDEDLEEDRDAGARSQALLRREGRRDPGSHLPEDQSEGEIRNLADRGTNTDTSPLPHRDRLESAFGRDLSGISAHTSPEALHSASALGGQAYASGSHVVVPASASVGLVAHEVAHVLQQDG